jgi:hypothetical protein
MTSATTRTFRRDAAFPVEPGESWIVRDGRGGAVERWDVIAVTPHGFTVAITRVQRP